MNSLTWLRSLSSCVAHSRCFRDGEAGAADEGDGEVAQGGERASAGADAASVLGEGDIADAVELVLDAPMVAGEAQQALRRGGLGRQAGDEIDDLSVALRAISRVR